MHETFCLGIISTRMLTDLTENNKWTSPKKNSCGLDLYGSGQRSARPAQIIGHGAQGRHPIQLIDRARPFAEVGAKPVWVNTGRMIRSWSTAEGYLLSRTELA
jgi:hypothetical protein